MNQELLKQANKESASVEQNQELLDMELKDVSGGKLCVTDANEFRGEFIFEYRNVNNHGIRDYIKHALRERGAPEDVISRIPLKDYTSLGSSGKLEVIWTPGMVEPIVTWYFME